MEFLLEEELVYDEFLIESSEQERNDGNEHSAADADDAQDAFFNEEIR